MITAKYQQLVNHNQDSADILQDIYSYIRVVFQETEPQTEHFTSNVVEIYTKTHSNWK